jgi:type IV secretory pathway TraG/TraD family ATPase VirD4
MSGNAGEKNERDALLALLAFIFSAFTIWLVFKVGLVPGLVCAAVALVLVSVMRWCWLPSRRLPGHRVRHLRVRLRLRLHPGRGHATIAELWWRWGRWAAFRSGKRTRPSLAWRARLTAGVWAYSVMIGRAHHRHSLRIGLEEHILVVAAPRTGKTGWLGRPILRYPGPVLSTTTKGDMFALTSRVRSRYGRIHTFNPQNVGNVPSTFAWNPVAGCREPATAIRRADAFTTAVSQKGVEEGAYWSAKASGCLRALFAAADLAGGDMRLVGHWILTGRTVEAETILTAHGAMYTEWAGALGELRGKAQKTAATIQMTLSRAVEFMADPALAAATLPGPGGGFDIETFVYSRDTVYLIAETRSDESPVAPLFACFATEVHYTAALLGSQTPSGRLDPPLLMALDEVTQICPVPLPSWLADSGGKGIQIITVAHGEAQLRERWGDNGARIIMDTSGTKMILPGVTDPDTLQMASRLCGQAALKERGEETKFGRHEVMTPDMISQLPPRFALVLRAGMAPVVASLRMVWKDRLYKRARRAISTAARATTAAAAASERRAIERAREQLDRPTPDTTEQPPRWSPPDPPADGGAWPWSTS